MRCIYKYHLDYFKDRFALDLPAGFTPRHVGFQGDRLCLWAEINEAENKRVVVDFKQYGTGHEIPDDMTYLATYCHGPFVAHIYYRIRA